MQDARSDSESNSCAPLILPYLLNFKDLPMKKHTLISSFKHLACAGFIAAGAVSLAPQDAAAFCGFYVSGGDAELFNNATQVALMREGTKTILSMQNDYQGPVKNFAMVVPVPVVLQKENVKTLSDELFKKMDALSAPRLVEYWEKDPCEPEVDYRDSGGGLQNSPTAVPESLGQDPTAPKVKVEAQFEVGEYDIVVLSSTEATALESWLKDNSYTIPGGATAIFNQYIQNGMYFFVAKVNPAKVTFKDQRAVLSPLRFDYDSPSFSLPVRLGMVNSSGTQDLIVYVLGKDQRYEVANYGNVTIPTNIEVSKKTRETFGDFYTKLFERTVEKNPNSVVTEYSWDASTCDPCPGPSLDGEDFAALGADVLAGDEPQAPWMFNRGWTITRLHARYSKDGISEDLVFKKAPSIVGGREFYGENEVLETGSSQGRVNNFQGRYIMRNRWSGALACANPVFGRWGGPPEGVERPDVAPALSPNSGGAEVRAISTETTEGNPLEGYVREEVPEIDVVPLQAAGDDASAGGCSSTAQHGAIPGMLVALMGMLGFWRRRRPSN